MALSLNNWNDLSPAEKNAVVHFLQGNCKIDLEEPTRSGSSRAGSYQISEGVTSGGHPMKYGKEYRIYLLSAAGCPAFLLNELRPASAPYAGRIGGSEAIRAIMDYGGLQVGYN